MYQILYGASDGNTVYRVWPPIELPSPMAYPYLSQAMNPGSEVLNSKQICAFNTFEDCPNESSHFLDQRCGWCCGDLSRFCEGYADVTCD